MAPHTDSPPTRNCGRGELQKAAGNVKRAGGGLFKQVAQRQLKHALDFWRMRIPCRPFADGGDARRHQRVAGKNKQRRQVAEPAQLGLAAQFLGELALSGVARIFVGIDQSAGETHLAAVPRERRRPHG